MYTAITGQGPIIANLHITLEHIFTDDNGSIVLGDNNPNPNLGLLSPSTIDARQ